MIRIASLFLGTIACLFALPAPFANAQYGEEQIVQSATTVLTETMSTPMNRIPQSMLANCQGVAIIPNVIKGSFIVGARHGRGLLFVREADGIWHAPVFVSLTGGNIGWQVGVQSSDIILVFKTQRSVQGILSGKLTLGADAAAAAGPVGRQGAVATDGQLQAEIYTYSRSRGLFAGVSIDGSVIQVDQLATGAYYRSPAPGQPVVVPPAAQRLTQVVASYADAATPAEIAPSTNPAPQYNSGLALQYRASESDVLRRQLMEIAPELYDLLDERWKAYLALPSSLYVASEHPNPAAIAATLEHFQSVAADPQYQQLALRPEFQSVYGLLSHYNQSLAAAPAGLQSLPPPPGL